MRRAEVENMRASPSQPVSPVQVAAHGHAAAEIELSIVVPVHNEAAGISEFFARLFAVLEHLRLGYEIICIDDGSTDASLAQLLQYRERIPALRILSLSRNFGKDIALSAGFDHARGAAVVPIDCDLARVAMVKVS
jgi:polyisoprenyl-phosphate glycosyltransferase